MTSRSAEFLAEIADAFQLQRTLAERAVAQLEPAQLFHHDGPEDNSIAVLMKHVGGNLRSRWTQPFTTDGEKPDRHRDTEFVVESDDADSIRRVWDRGWSALEQTLRDLTVPDLERDILIRGETNTLAHALLRSLAHTAQHVGQIILLAKHARGTSWQTLSIPRGESDRYLSRPL